MPKRKIEREDVLRKAEIDDMLVKASTGITHYHFIESKKPDEFGFTTIKFNAKMIQCLIALLWLFGKRITENLRVKRKDVRVKDGCLYVLFYVLKKKSRKASPIAYRKLKRITLENPYTDYVLQYLETVTDPESFLFSGYSRGGIFKVTNKETGKTYVYERIHKPRMSRQHAYRILKGLNPQGYCHLFRESLATEMAEHGATEEELMQWFDWDRYAIAHTYVKGGPKLTEKWAKRTW